MKRMLLVLATLLFLNSVMVPNIARADGPGSGNCTGLTCKP